MRLTNFLGACAGSEVWACRRLLLFLILKKVKMLSSFLLLVVTDCSPSVDSEDLCKIFGSNESSNLKDDLDVLRF